MENREVCFHVSYSESRPDLIIFMTHLNLVQISKHKREQFRELHIKFRPWRGLHPNLCLNTLSTPHFFSALTRHPNSIALRTVGVTGKIQLVKFFGQLRHERIGVRCWKV